MFVTVDSERCQGHGLCYMHCPDIFAPDDEAFAVVIRQPTADELPAVRVAVDGCPERAIALSPQG